MNINLLSKIRKKYRLVLTSENDWIWEFKVSIPLINFDNWDVAKIGSDKYGYFHKSRNDAIYYFIKYIHEKYRKGDYKRKKIYCI